MPLYGTVCLVEYGTMWRHGSSPTKLSCGGVAGTLREQGIWPPVHGFSKLVYWGFAARPFGRQARDRRQFKNHGFSVAGTNFLCKTMCFLLREQKGLPATVQKPWFFLLREEMGVLKTTKSMTLLAKSSCGVQWYFFLVAGAR